MGITYDFGLFKRKQNTTTVKTLKIEFYNTSTYTFFNRVYVRFFLLVGITRANVAYGRTIQTTRQGRK